MTKEHILGQAPKEVQAQTMYCGKCEKLRAKQKGKPGDQGPSVQFVHHSHILKISALQSRSGKDELVEIPVMVCPRCHSVVCTGTPRPFGKLGQVTPAVPIKLEDDSRSESEEEDKDG